MVNGLDMNHWNQQLLSLKTWKGDSRLRSKETAGFFICFFIKKGHLIDAMFALWDSNHKLTTGSIKLLWKALIFQDFLSSLVIIKMVPKLFPDVSTVQRIKPVWLTEYWRNVSNALLPQDNSFLSLRSVTELDGRARFNWHYNGHILYQPSSGQLSPSQHSLWPKRQFCL